MKSFFSFLLGVILTSATLVFFYQNYLVPEGIPSLVGAYPTQVEPSVTLETCETQRVYGRGYSFCLPASHTLEETSTDMTQKFTITSTLTWDIITIEHDLTRTSYTDSDAKFGDVTVNYNPEKKIWEAMGECDTSKKCSASFTNKHGLQVFVGRSRWLTYIVPRENAGIIVMNSTGGGFTGPLEELIQTLRKEKE